MNWNTFWLGWTVGGLIIGLIGVIGGTLTMPVRP